MKWRCHCLHNFFGPRDEDVNTYESFFGPSVDYMKGVYTQFYYLAKNGIMSFTEAYNLPVGLRNFYVNLLVEDLKKEKEAIEKAQNQSKQ